MKKNILLTILFLSIGLLYHFNLLAQNNCSLAQVSSASMTSQSVNIGYWSGIMEIPFLLISVVFAFATAQALKGGKFGKGMNLIAWGFVVMAIGHFHMQIEHFYNYNILKGLLGEAGGTLAWFIALVLTWGFSGLGFYSILKASKGK